MKTIDLNSIPYKHRFNGASLLVAKANRLAAMGSAHKKGNEQKLLAALCYYDMALALMKPFDSNYSCALNWKCNVLRSLGQYEDAVDWYREIFRISNEIDGNAQSDPTAALANEMIHKYAGRKNEPLESGNADAAVFDNPPYCMFAEEFCVLLSEGKFKKSHLYLSPALKKTFPIPKLNAEWQQMTRKMQSEEMGLTLEQHMVDWPSRRPNDIGWCYFCVLAGDFAEAITIVVGRMPDNFNRCITQLEFGRP